MNESKVHYRYVGNGSYLQGVPAHDLTEADVQALSPALQETLRSSVLYQPASNEMSKKKPIIDEEK